MTVLGGVAFSYERGAPVGDLQEDRAVPTFVLTGNCLHSKQGSLGTGAPRS